MNQLRAIILGVIEGLSEFLPVSSTGHLIVAMPVLGIDGRQQPWPVFLFFIQIGAILAVIVYFWRDLWQSFRHVPAAGWRYHLMVKLFVAFLPGAVIGLALDDFMETYLESAVPVACALILGAAAMELIDRRFRTPGEMSVDQITLRQALGVGLAQCVSIIPGTSRSMATIMGGLLVGLPATTATRFSFYLAIPTLLAAGGYKLFKYRDQIHADEAALLATGFAVSFVVAMGVIAWFLRYVATHRFRVFAIYRVVLGGLVLGYWALYGRQN